MLSEKIVEKIVKKSKKIKHSFKKSVLLYNTL